MGRTCTVCSHPNRAAIDEGLVSGEAYRRIAGRFGRSATAVQRHQAHIPPAVAKAQGAKELAAAETLAEKLAWITSEARRLGQKAEQAGDVRTALAAVREFVRVTELAAKISGELRLSVDLKADFQAPFSPEDAQKALDLLAKRPKTLAQLIARGVELTSDSSYLDGVFHEARRLVGQSRPALTAARGGHTRG